MTCNKGRPTGILETCWEKKSRKNIWKETYVVVFLYTWILMLILVVMVNVKAVTPRIGVIVHQMKTWTSSQHSYCNVIHKCFCTDNSCWVIYLPQMSTHPMLPAFFKYLWSLSSPEFDSTFCTTYTRWPRRNVPDLGRVFLMLNYTDITQNTYVQSWTVTEIMDNEVWNFDSCYTLIDY